MRRSRNRRRSMRSTSAIPLYQQDVWQPYFRRLRRDAPVHYCKEETARALLVGDQAQGHHRARGRPQGVFVELDARRHTLRDQSGELELPMFIAMDPPKHDVQRKVVQPIVSPENLANFEGLIRDRVRDTLDGLPRGETFDWVDKVSIELTARCWRPCSTFRSRTGAS